MLDFVIHDAAGVIRHLARAEGMPQNVIEAFWPRQPGETLTFLEAPLQDPNSWLIMGGVPVARQTMTPVLSKTTIAADGADACVITGLPDPCTIRIEGALMHGPVAVAGGTLTLTCTTPGTLALLITCEPSHKPWKGNIHAA